MTYEPNRNDPCLCGSGKKYKYCCMDSDDPQFHHENGGLFPKQLNDLIQEGYGYWKENEYEETADRWLQAWDRVKDFLQSDDDDIKQVDKRLVMTQSLFNWSQDLEMCLHNAGTKNDEYLSEQIQYCDEFCELLPDTRPSVLRGRRKAAAEACFHLGRVDEGENRFEVLVEDYPDSPWVLINWGDMYGQFRRHPDVPHDPERARELYEQARPLLDEYERNAVKNRLTDLEEEINQGP